MRNQGIIARYREYLPVGTATPVVTLHEGSTLLLPAPRLSSWISPHIELFLKFEGLNPTGSFKDRGMTLAVSKAREEGMQTLMCASTGNTSASAAAYAARCGMQCVVLIPTGKTALGKLAQALIHGARVLSVDGNFDDALCLVREITSEYPIALVNSVNPHRLEGQKTVAFEIVDDLGRAPDIHAMPVGNAGNMTAAWRGYREYHAAKNCGLPRMLGFQAEGAAPIVRKTVVQHPDTVATAIRIGNPASWKGAEAARDESGGHIGMVSDQQILEAYRAVPELEGIFAEPASVVPIAGLRMLAQQGYFTQPATVVVTLTGHGLKDPDTATQHAGRSVISVSAERSAVLAALGY